MRGVRPITKEEAGKALAAFTGRYQTRDRALFLFQFYTGRRISQTLALRIGDVITEQGDVAPSVYFERRTVKKKTAGESIYLHRTLRKALRLWAKELREMGYFHRAHFIFQSGRGKNRPLTRHEAYNIYHRAFRKAGIWGKLGTHSLRKSFASAVYDHFDRDLVKTQHALGHIKIDSTVSYLNSFRNEEFIAAIDSLEEVNA